MNIYVLRHGLAAKDLNVGPRGDQNRPLTAKGRKKMIKIAEAMKRMRLSPELIYSSPFLRARQTAQLVARTLHTPRRIEFLDELAAGVSPETLLGELARHSLPVENLLLVGHEPQLSRFIALLSSGSTHLNLQLKKGGLCKLSTPALKSGQRATLEWLLTPKLMLTMH